MHDSLFTGSARSGRAAPPRGYWQAATPVSGQPASSFSGQGMPAPGAGICARRRLPEVSAILSFGIQLPVSEDDASSGKIGNLEALPYRQGFFSSTIFSCTPTFFKLHTFKPSTCAAKMLLFSNMLKLF